MNITSATYEIPAIKLAGVQAKIDKLNRRCKRLSIPEITVSVLKAYNEKRYVRGESLDANDLIDVPYNTVEVTGGRPALNGWEFAATFEHDAETGLTIFRSNPAFKLPIPVEYRKAKAKCDHCNLERRRNDTFLVYSAATAEFKQIGRNCLRDFLGHTDPHSVAAAAEFWCDVQELFSDSEEDGFGGGGSGESILDLEHFVERSFAVVRVRGFLGRGKVRETGNGIATADRIIRLLFPSREDRQSPEWRAEDNVTQVTDADKARATAALEWIRALNTDNASDYIHNLFVACAGELLPARRIGIVASLPAAYLKHLDRAEELRKAREEKPVSQFVGKVKERLRGLTLKCERVIPHETMYGTTYITKLSDKDGNAFTWFASGHSLNEGETYTVTGTVKSHEDSEKYGKQTILTRCQCEVASVSPLLKKT